jgi:hypothetical protein
VSRWLPDRKRARRTVWGADAQGITWHGPAGEVALAAHGEEAQRALGTVAVAGSIDVVAGSDLAVHWVQQPPAAARSLQELRLAAAARCAHLFGGTAADWWVAGDWTMQRAFVCSGLPRAVTQPMQQAAAARNLRLRWHSAWSVHTAARAASLPNDGWSALRTPRRVLLWHCSAGRVDAMTGFVTSADASGAEVQAQAAMHVQLETLVGCAGDADTVHWSDPGGELPPREALAALRMGASLQGVAR